MMNRLNREDIKVGDIVGVPFPVTIGWTRFRYQKIVPMTVARITPARTKIVMTNGREIDRKEPLYEIDKEVKHQSHIAECAGNISNKLYQLGEMKRDDSLFRKSDTQIENVSFLLDKIMEVLADD
jgi:hypothetical protein